MRWIAVTAMLVVLGLVLTGSVLAQENRVFENVDASGMQVKSPTAPVVTQVIPTSSPFQTTKLDDRGIR